MTSPARRSRVALALSLALLVPLGAARAQDDGHDHDHDHGTTASGSVQDGDTLVGAEPSAVDFGDVLAGEEAQAVVVFTNIGQDPLPVTQVKTTCGCTVATLKGPDGERLPSRSAQTGTPLVVLGPGQQLTASVALDTGRQNGKLEKQLQLYGSDTSHPLLQVPVRARVTKAFSVNPQNLNLGNIDRSSRVEQTLVIQSHSSEDWTIDGFESALPGQELPEGWRFEVLDTEGLSRRVQVVSEGNRKVGPLTTKVRAKVTHEKIKGVEFFVYGRVESDVRFDSGNPNLLDTLSFEQMAKGETRTRTLTITNGDPSTPYLLKTADVQIPSTIKPLFETTIRTLEEGVSYEVDLTVKADMDQPFFRGNLILGAEHPDVPSRPISFHGFVKQD